MKKSILFLTPILFTLLACSPNGSGSSSQDDMFAKDVVKVYFFESAVKYDRSNPFALVECEVGSKIANPGTPTSSDPAFNTFLGWSAKPIIMDESELWDFAEDSVPTYVPGGEYYIYAQCNYVE